MLTSRKCTVLDINVIQTHMLHSLFLFHLHKTDRIFYMAIVLAPLSGFGDPEKNFLREAMAPWGAD